jgi:uncharacterized protein
MSTQQQALSERSRSHSDLVEQKKIIAGIKLDLLPFVPVVGLETSHSQTLLGHFIKSKTFEASGRQEYLKLPDGDLMSLKIYPNEKPAVVTLFHGLAGDHTSDYIQRSAKLAYDLGYSVVLVDHRGAGLAEGKARRPYHSGRGDDASEVSLKLKEFFPDKKQIFIGFSMSGSILLNLVSGRYGKHKPDFCVVVNAPLNLYKASTFLTKGFSRFYDLRFYFLLKKLIRKAEPNIYLPTVAKTRMIDDLFTSKRSGFVDSLDYYTQCSSYPYLDRIDVPTFVLTSKDDPFIAFEDYANAQWNDFTHRTFIDYGGHMGYISKHRSEKYGIRWLDDYLHKVLLAIESL